MYDILYCIVFIHFYSASHSKEPFRSTPDMLLFTSKHRRRPGAEFGGTEKKLADQNLIFLNDLLWGEKILKTFFSHRLYFSDFACLYFCQMFYMLTCMALSSWEKSLFHKKSFMTPFFTQFVLSHASNNTTSQNIGGTDAWAVPPPQSFGGP